MQSSFLHWVNHLCELSNIRWCMDVGMLVSHNFIQTTPKSGFLWANTRRTVCLFSEMWWNCSERRGSKEHPFLNHCTRSFVLLLMLGRGNWGRGVSGRHKFKKTWLTRGKHSRKSIETSTRPEFRGRYRWWFWRWRQRFLAHRDRKHRNGKELRIIMRRSGPL